MTTVVLALSLVTAGAACLRGRAAWAWLLPLAAAVAGASLLWAARFGGSAWLAAAAAGVGLVLAWRPGESQAGARTPPWAWPLVVLVPVLAFGAAVALGQLHPEARTVEMAAYADALSQGLPPALEVSPMMRFQATLLAGFGGSALFWDRALSGACQALAAWALYLLALRLGGSWLGALLAVALVYGHHSERGWLASADLGSCLGHLLVVAGWGQLLAGRPGLALFLALPAGVLQPPLGWCFLMAAFLWAGWRPSRSLPAVALAVGAVVAARLLFRHPPHPTGPSWELLTLALPWLVARANPAEQLLVAWELASWLAGLPGTGVALLAGLEAGRWLQRLDAPGGAFRLRWSRRGRAPLGPAEGRPDEAPEVLLVLPRRWAAGLAALALAVLGAAPGVAAVHHRIAEAAGESPLAWVLPRADGGGPAPRPDTPPPVFPRGLQARLQGLPETLPARSYQRVQVQLFNPGPGAVDLDALAGIQVKLDPPSSRAALGQPDAVQPLPRGRLAAGSRVTWPAWLVTPRAEGVGRTSVALVDAAGRRHPVDCSPATLRTVGGRPGGVSPPPGPG